MNQQPVVHPLHPVVLLLAAGFVIPELMFALGALVLSAALGRQVGVWL